MSSTIPEILAVLKNRLQEITLANGYQTEVVGVYEGDELIGLDESLQPVYVAISLLDERDIEYSTNRAAKAELSVLVLGFLNVSADFGSMQRAFAHDVRQAIKPWVQRPLDGKAVRIDQFRASYPPPERGAALATVDISFNITFVESFTPAT